MRQFPLPTKVLTMAGLTMLFFVSCKQEKPAAPPREVKQYTIEQFYKTKATGAGLFSPDEQKLLVHTNESGIFNLYEITLVCRRLGYPRLQHRIFFRRRFTG